MKRVFLFAGEAYDHTATAMSTYVDAFETVAEAKAYFAEHPNDWAEIAELTDDGLKQTWDYGTWRVPYRSGVQAHSVTEWREV